MGTRRTPKRGTTPPKGRPTTPRRGRYGDDRVFGPMAQWLAVIVALILAFALLLFLTGGGDFNPFNNQLGSLLAVTAAGVLGSNVT
jgi:hypothetical protein